MTAREVIVIAEHLGGELSDITLEMLACARDVARTIGWRVTCLILADDPEPFKALPLASDRILIVKDPVLGSFNPTAYIRVLIHMLKELSPQLILLGNTSVGMDLAGPLSIGLNVPVASGCVAIRAADGGLVVMSRLLGGKLQARTEVLKGTVIALLLPGNYSREVGMRDTLPTAEIRPSPEPLGALPVRFLELVEPKMEDIDVRKAAVLVAAGRGIQSKENLAAVEDLAEALGGAVCSTRPVVDQGWLPRSRQIGRSGMTVKPRLYLALGISGAPEHVEGMKDSELIVAVNTDPDAPIFDVAHYGTTVDLLDLVPVLTERIRNLRGG